jgi:hypothetical protein
MIPACCIKLRQGVRCLRHFYNHQPDGANPGPARFYIAAGKSTFAERYNNIKKPGARAFSS